VHFKHEQPQILSPDLYVTIGTIQQTEEAANVHWVHRLNQDSNCCFFSPRSVFSIASDCLGFIMKDPVKFVFLEYEFGN